MLICLNLRMKHKHTVNSPDSWTANLARSILLGFLYVFSVDLAFRDSTYSFKLLNQHGFFAIQKTECIKKHERMKIISLFNIILPYNILKYFLKKGF